MDADSQFFDRVLRLNVFCEREGEAFRVHVDPASVPPYLRACLDMHGEAFPVFLDLEELERYVREAGGTLLCRTTRFGSQELDATAPAADALGRFLVTAISSGVRPPREQAAREPRRND